jgi:hypothetical protein
MFSNCELYQILIKKFLLQVAARLRTCGALAVRLSRQQLLGGPLDHCPTCHPANGAVSSGARVAMATPGQQENCLRKHVRSGPPG